MRIQNILFGIVFVMLCGRVVRAMADTEKDKEKEVKDGGNDVGKYVGKEKIKS